MADSDERYVVTHVDFKPPFAEQGRAAMRHHAEMLKAAPGFIRCEVLQQTARANHFELLTVWASDEAYEAHHSLDATVEFRTDVYSMLGSPWDDRIHQLLEVVEPD